MYSTNYWNLMCSPPLYTGGPQSKWAARTVSFSMFYGGTFSHDATYQSMKQTWTEELIS